MVIRFDQPAILWGLVLLPVLAWALFRWGGSMSLGRRVVAVGVRAGLMALALGIVAGASIVRETDRLAVMAVVDVSGSVRELATNNASLDTATGGNTERAGTGGVAAARAWLAAAARDRGPDDALGIIAFDGRSAMVMAPKDGPGALRDFDISMAEGTDMAQAIRLALAAFPRDATRRMVIISDGVSTRGDPIAAAREGGAGGNGVEGVSVPIDVVPLTYNLEREVLIDALDAPTVAPSGAVVALRIAITSTGPARGTLHVTEEETPIDLGDGPSNGRAITLAAGRNFVIVNVPLGPERVHRFRARFEPAEPEPGDAKYDTIIANNSAEAVTVTSGQGAVLVVNGNPPTPNDPNTPDTTLARTLRQEGFEVDAIAPEGLPLDLLRLQAYDLIILENVPADALGLIGQARLASYVSELGGGLVMVGGPASFGAGGYKGGPLEPLLPVKLELPDRLVLPSLAVVFVLDCSGSMGWSVMGSSRSQQDIANEGAAAAVRTLDQTDLVGVITFNERAQVRIPLGRHTDPAKTIDIIMAISPGGGTNMPPALELAIGQLTKADAKLKHIVVLTDGVSRGRDRLEGLARAAAQADIKVSTIAVGDEPDPDMLARVAEVGGGAYYRVVDPMSLPRVFMRAVRVARTPMIREVPFVPVVADRTSPLLDGVLAAMDASGGMPPLNGLALTQVRPEPTAIFPLLSPEGEPVLAHWRAGLGQVAAFTSDAHRWAEPWLAWPGYRALWTRIARQISRPAGGRTAELAASFQGDELTLRLEASGDDGRPLDGLTVPGAVYSPDGQRVDITLTQDGPGAYQATLRGEHAPGNYVVTVSPRGQGSTILPVIGGVTRARGAEYRALRSDEATLRAIAKATGGRVLDIAGPERAALFDRQGVPPRLARTPLWPVLLPWVLALALLDVAVRRIAWDRLLSSRFGETLMRHAARSVRDRSAQVAGTVAALREKEAEFDVKQDAQATVRLSARDAKRIVEERRQKMIAEQRAKLRGAGRKGPAPSGPPSSATSSTPEASPPTPAEGEGGGGGLLEAKRRARAKFDDHGA